MLFKAIEFAAHAHSGQYRKATRLPYILHPLNVARILIEHECRESVVVAGVLHDTVEDTSVTLADIEAAFGAEVARLVRGASEENKQDVWERRKQRFITSLRQADEDTLLVVCADKLDNLRSIRRDYEKLGEALWSRFTRAREQQHWYFTEVLKVLQARLHAHEPGAALVQAIHEEIQRVFDEHA